VQIALAAQVVMELLEIPAGDFLMGSSNELFYEAPVRHVSVGSDWFLGKYPVTQQQWLAVMGENPSIFRDSLDLPVDSVSWDRAVEFCDRLGAQCGHRVRLPSEAEWEYACRAGTSGDFFFGPWGPFMDDQELPWEVQLALTEYAWFELNGNERTHAVGLKNANPWGLHDMLGNVWEWCADTWHGAYRGAPSDTRAWLDIAEQQPRRCLRGGAWDMNAFRCRSSYRSFDHRELGTHRFGFRVAVSEFTECRS
jgi:formylglycine-generating enzyme required for sulfatase activity